MDGCDNCGGDECPGCGDAPVDTDGADDVASPEGDDDGGADDSDGGEEDM